ncbi:UxaA family hydrolase [Lacrimispora sp. 210928-DFI.3.58]|uniref:UxaA family hydrolase n=1 Tax=Lacrimispora sp. 210928-DFI.3.58 TaxID=2883214 RepID=UPI001D0864D7|nr:UxaA family hydrolase [Lacrimispora sp. 210928-DFI.3.58]MCB7317244.1 UxaA family hydrolase [Lacrimispora sp. 210928-DFI.3.58]
MEINGLLMDETDNVVTCVREVAAGEQVVYRKGEVLCSLTANEDIPYCHKIALKDLDKGATVIKYGETIGKTNYPIGRGDWVSHNNIYSVPRDYDSELIAEGGK